MEIINHLVKGYRHCISSANWSSENIVSMYTYCPRFWPFIDKQFSLTNSSLFFCKLKIKISFAFILCTLTHFLDLHYRRFVSNFHLFVRRKWHVQLYKLKWPIIYLTCRNVIYYRNGTNFYSIICKANVTNTVQSITSSFYFFNLQMRL